MASESEASDFERIWLSPVCDECRHLDVERTWCQDKVNECEECGKQPVEFVLVGRAPATPAGGVGELVRATMHHLQADGALDRGLLCDALTRLSTALGEREAECARKTALLTRARYVIRHAAEGNSVLIAAGELLNDLNAALKAPSDSGSGP